MIPFLYFAVADTIVAPSDYETVHVHEWGVIELDVSFPEALGARWGYLGEDGVLDPWTEYEVEAPVIWFHGAECRGTLTVNAKQGYFTTLLPRPDSLVSGEAERMMSPDAVGSQTAIWRDVSVSPVMMELEEEILPVAWDAGGFGWAIPFWRDVGGNYIAVPGSSYRDSFIYYECTAASIPGIEHECAEGPMTYGYRGEALVFSPGGDGVTARLVSVGDEITTIEEELTDTEVMSVICGWGGLKSTEIQALWNTWEPAVLQRCLRGGERVILFPLTPEQTESVSSIEFSSGGDNPVVYERLFLGIGSI
jgi:hypothetical protein